MAAWMFSCKPCKVLSRPSVVLDCLSICPAYSSSNFCKMTDTASVPLSWPLEIMSYTLPTLVPLASANH